MHHRLTCVDQVVKDQYEVEQSSSLFPGDQKLFIIVIHKMNVLTRRFMHSHVADPVLVSPNIRCQVEVSDQCKVHKD